jgi:MoaA/NifB/PqqE/SkfB family radical SAM enzyme
MVTNSKTFCLHPFTHLEVANTGEIGPCCRFDRYYKMDDGSTAKITDSFDSIVNSNHSLELKKSLLNGEQHPGCHRCWRDEAAGIASQRQRYNQRYPEYQDHFTYHDQFKLLSFDLKLGNTCNQMCVICHPGNSSMLASEYKIMFNGNSRYDTADLSWYRNEENMKQIENHLDSILHIDFFGGEPWLIKQQWKILQTLINLGRSHEVTLNYATNGSIFKEEYFEIFAKFRKVSILFSADGIEKTFEYGRYPGKWDVFKNNLQQSLSYANQSLSINIGYTVSIYSIFNIIESLEYYSSISNKTNNLKVWFNLVNNEEYSIKNLPIELKEQLIKKLVQYQDINWPTFDKNVIYSIIQELEKPYSEYEWNKFINITTRRDQHRSQSISTIIPELSWTNKL